MVVERHRGKVDFTSKPGDGTTFRITFPAPQAQ
jgi:signal transduction histidine kinase